MREQPLIHVVDDERSFRTAVARLLEAAGFEVRTYPSVSEFLSAEPGSRSGCVLADLKMPGRSGLDLQDALSVSDHPIPIIFLTGHGDIASAVRATRDGAVDFLTKPVTKERLFDAVGRALAVDAASRQRSAQIDEWRARFQRLTPREREVLAYVIAGKQNKQIAFHLGAGERTIKAHRASIVSKLGVRSVAELVRASDTVNFHPAG